MSIKKYANLLHSFVFAIFLALCVTIPAYAGGLVTEGRDEFGRRIEMIKLPGGGTEVHTYDPKTGVELFSKTYVGTYTGPDTLFPKVKSESTVNSETGERTVITYNDPFDHSKGKTERKYIDSRVLGQIRDNERELKEVKNPQSVTPKKQEPDEWDFLPGFKPGESVYEHVDTTNQTNSSGDNNAMPLADPEIVTPEPSTESTPEPNSDSFGGVNEPKPEEIDFSKYGDQMGFDPQTGTSLVIDSKANTVTYIYPREGGWFGNSTWTTKAVTKRDGKVIHEDYYAHNGKLVQSVDIDPRSGVRISTTFNPDGSQTMIKTDAKGNVIENKATSTDPETGVTTTSVQNPDSTRTVTKTDKDGNVISVEMFDQNGKLIQPKNEKTSQKSKSQSKASASANDSFAAFDSISNGPLGSFDANSNSTPSSRDIAAAVDPAKNRPPEHYGSTY